MIVYVNGNIVSMAIVLTNDNMCTCILVLWQEKTVSNEVFKKPLKLLFSSCLIFHTLVYILLKNL